MENSQTLWLGRMVLNDFRNYERAEVEMSPGINLVSGANAQGKTSLLEGVSLLSTGRLLRGSKDAQAIRHGAESSTVSCEIGGSGTEIKVVLRRGTKKRVELNGTSLPRASDLIGRLPTVSFSAADLCIVTGDPSDRRQFLDWELAQLSPSYLKALTVYKRSIEHRNALLRQSQEQVVPAVEFEPWEVQIAAAGTAVRHSRMEWVQTLELDSREAHSNLGGGETLDLRYEVRDNGNDAESFASLLESSRGFDVARGSTSCGPHRDELMILVKGQEARYFGSQGQQRTAVIAMKLATLTSAEKMLRVTPILLLDDVFSDLDIARRSRLMDLTLGRGGQVFLTCTEPELAGSGLLEGSRIFKVESGQVRVQ